MYESKLLAQGNEFFCGGRVNRDRIIKVSFGRAHFDSDREALNHFICCATNNVTTNHFFILTRDNKFYRRTFIKAIGRILEPDGFEFPELTDFEIRIPKGGHTSALTECFISWDDNGRRFKTRGDLK